MITATTSSRLPQTCGLILTILWWWTLISRALLREGCLQTRGCTWIFLTKSCTSTISLTSRVKQSPRHLLRRAYQTSIIMASRNLWSSTLRSLTLLTLLVGLICRAIKQWLLLRITQKNKAWRSCLTLSYINSITCTLETLPKTSTSATLKATFTKLKMASFPTY